MPSQTPVYALPYPLGSELVKDGDDVIKALAERVEALLAQRDVLGRRNVIRNGDFTVAQRGNGPHGTNGAYGTDGYQFMVTGACAGQMTRNVLPTSSAPNKYSLTFTVATPASAAADYLFINIPIEDVRTLSGRTVTLSFKASASVAGRVAGISVRQYFGTGGSPSTVVDTAIGNVTLTASVASYSLTFTVPSIAAKTIGTNDDDYLAIRIWLATGATQLPNSGFSSAGQGTQAAWALTILELQLEDGAIATPFERMPQALQQHWCRRYYQRWDVTSAGQGHFWSGLASSTTSVFMPMTFNPPMRAVPAVTYAGLGSSDGSVSNKTNISTVTFLAGYVNNQHGLLQLVFATAQTNAHWPEIMTLNGAGAYLALSSEL
jgi:hypothetical protein